MPNILTNSHKLSKTPFKTVSPVNSGARLVYHSYGSQIAVGIYGTKEQIEAQFASFYNNGAAGRTKESPLGDESSLIWETKTFAWFWSTPAKLKRALSLAHLNKWNNEQNSGYDLREMPRFKGELENLVAAWIAANIPEEKFHTLNNQGVSSARSLGVFEGCTHWGQS